MPHDIKNLRRQAEERLRHLAGDVSGKDLADVKKLIHELEVHQIELGMQNEELRRSQEKLGESRDKFQELYDLAPVGYFTLDKKARIRQVNLTGADLVGLQRSKLINTKFSRLITPDSQDDFYLHCKKTYETQAPQSCELQLKQKDSTLLYVQLASNVEQDGAGNYSQLRVVVTDISRRRQAEDELQKSHGRLEAEIAARTAELLEANRKLNSEIEEHKQASGQIRNLTRQLIRAQESERLMISRELHDSLAQELGAAKMQCDYLLSVGSADAPRPVEKIKKISGILSKAIADVRNLAYGLRPAGLKQFGLVETLLQHCRDFSETQRIPVDFQAAGFQKITVDEDTAINIYRLIQEGLANIKKHADASQVKIRLIVAFPFINLRIKDNGKGFDVSQRQATLSNEKKLGLRSMQERAELLNGSMKIDSKPGSGTSLLIKIPINERHDARKKNHIDR